MFKKGLLLSVIFLLIFSISGFATDYTFTQQSGSGYFVSGSDKADSLEDQNELRTIVNDLGTLLGHSKMNGTYPADSTTGGSLSVLSNYYLKTAIDTQGEMETIWGVALANDGDLASYYLKTAIDTIGEVETIWGLDVTTSTELATYCETTQAYYNAIGDLPTAAVTTGDTTHVPTSGGVFTFCETTQNYLKTSENSDSDDDISDDSIFDLSDIPADPNADKYLFWDDDPGEFLWVDGAGGGYTNLTSFVAQTAWRVFYSNTDGDVTELALGADGTYLKSNGAAAAPTFDTPSGAGDMLKSVYDTDEDGDVDVASGGTEKSSWTQYAIPYLSGATAFGEIEVGTAGYALTVAAGATGYGWTDMWTEAENTAAAYISELKDDATPELTDDLECNNKDLTETKTVQFNGVYAIGNSGSTETIDWQNGEYQSITIDEACVISFSNEYVGTLNLYVTYGGSFALTFDGGITLLEAGGTEIVTTDAVGVDLLMFKNFGTADTYVMGALLDIKD